MDEKTTKKARKNVVVSSNFNDVACEFEKTHAKIKSIGRFSRAYDNKIEIISKMQLVNTYEHMTYTKTLSDGKEVFGNFINDWMRNNPRQKSYESMGTYPPDAICPENTLNLWTPFDMEVVTEYTEKPKEMKFILDHLEIMCNRDKKVFNYFILWIAQMIQYPSTKTNMPIFISKQGAGKTSIVRLLSKMLGDDKVFETLEPSRDVWGTFNGRMVTAFLVVLSELEKAETTKCLGKIKGLQVDPKITINKKGIDAYPIDSIHRFIVPTNHDDAIETSSDDRRNWFIQASDELIGNKVYFDKFYALLGDVNVVKTCFEYFKNVAGTKEFHHIPMPVTAHAKDLHKLSETPVRRFMKEYVLGMHKAAEKVILAKQLYQYFVEWSASEGLQFVINHVKFGLQVKKLSVSGIEKHKNAYGLTEYAIDVPVAQKFFGFGLNIPVEKKKKLVLKMIEK